MSLFMPTCDLSLNRSISSQMINHRKTKQHVLEEAQKFAFIQPDKNISTSTLRHYHTDGTMLAGAGNFPCLIIYLYELIIYFQDPSI